MYCVYLITYTGTLNLPKYYIGSTSVSKLENGYRGSISKNNMYWPNWYIEKRNNISSMPYEILSTHLTRAEALKEEMNEHIKRNVRLDSNYINFKSINSREDGFSKHYAKVFDINLATRRKRKFEWVPANISELLSYDYSRYNTVDEQIAQFEFFLRYVKLNGIHRKKVRKEFHRLFFNVEII